MENVYRIVLEPDSGVEISNLAHSAYELGRKVKPRDGVVFVHNDKVYRAYLTWSEDTTLTKIRNMEPPTNG